MTQIRFAAALLAIASLAACRAAPGAGAVGAAQASNPANVAASAPAAEAAATPQTTASAVQVEPGASAPTGPVKTGSFTGAVTETMNSGGYTYMSLHGGKDGKEDVWVAAPEFTPRKGERVTVPLEMAMEQFHSKTLNRDFPVIYFVSKVARDGENLAEVRGPAAGAAPISMMGSHQAEPAARTAPLQPIQPPPGGMKIADVWAKREALSGKPVVVRGKVVKVNNGIMGRNWFHLQDGSGTAADHTDDLTVTSAGETKVGDIVTVSGVLATNKDFGAGYAYDAILENATVTGK